MVNSNEKIVNKLLFVIVSCNKDEKSLWYIENNIAH